MKLLHEEFQLETFCEHLRVATKRALLLDYDGTLAPFRIQANQAMPYPGIRGHLRTMLAAQHTRLVIISGRALDQLIPLLRIRPLPELWGSHGWERLSVDGAYSLAPLQADQERGLAAARAWVVSSGLMEHCEEKPTSCAIHWRGLEPTQIALLRERALIGWAPIAQEAALSLHTFDGGIELRALGRDKGYAVRTILDEMGTDAVAAYLGDDLTDEDAFKAISQRGLSVLVRREFRETSADLWLKPPKELLKFLAEWHAATKPAVVSAMLSPHV